MFCDHCDRGYHSYCVGLKEIPKGENTFQHLSLKRLQCEPFARFYTKVSSSSFLLVEEWKAVCQGRRSISCHKRNIQAPLLNIVTAFKLCVRFQTLSQFWEGPTLRRILFIYLFIYLCIYLLKFFQWESNLTKMNWLSLLFFSHSFSMSASRF